MEEYEGGKTPMAIEGPIVTKIGHEMNPGQPLGGVMRTPMNRGKPTSQALAAEVVRSKVVRKRQ